MSRSTDANGHDLCDEMVSRDQKLIADACGAAPVGPTMGPSISEHPEAHRRTTGKENVPSQTHRITKGSETACSNKSQKSLEDNLDTSVTFAETFSRSDEVADISLRNTPRSSLFTSSADHEEKHHFESRDCNINDERRDDDDERDDEQPNQNTAPFLQTRVEYAEPYVEKERAFMFLASSSDSWNFDVARETSLFDDDGSELDDDFDNASFEQMQPYDVTPPFVDNGAQSKSRLGFGFCIWDHQW